jgi:hypothetical protein
LTALDAATGAVLRTYEDSRATEEIVMKNDILYLLVNPAPLDRNKYNPVNMVCWDETNRVAQELPWNGLIYAPPHPCACYLEAKLNGFCALAPKSPYPRSSQNSVVVSARLERGPSYSPEEATASTAILPEEWPTYRHDPARSGSTKTFVSSQLVESWKTDLGGKLSSLVVAGGKVLLAAVNTHTVHALDVKSGKPLWAYTAGGRIDSPPSLSRGRAVFGATDGWVYCLRLADGKLLWRYRVAPEDRRIISFDQLESVWPVHGSVLIMDGVVYCVAGRSSFLDGGIHFYQLDLMTGQKLLENDLNDRDPDINDNIQAHVEVLNMPVALPDILSSDGLSIYMRSQRLGLDGSRQHVALANANPVALASIQTGAGRHLFCPSGFLDESWWHRTYWIYGKTYSSGCNYWFRAGRFTPAGRILVFDDTSVYGYGRKPALYVWTPVLEYHLYKAAKDVTNASIQRVASANKRMETEVKRAIFNRQVTRDTALENISAMNFNWTNETPDVLVRAMVLAKDTLFVAGPPDLVDEEEVFERRNDEKIRAQNSALEGQRGALLKAVSAVEGTELAEYKLEAPPVWDGLVAAYGCLFYSSIDGKVVCLEGVKKAD